MAERTATCRRVIQLEATMIDPFFFDRLMRAFTTANSTPLTRADKHAATSQCTPGSAGEALACRSVWEAEAVAAEAFRSAQPMHSGTPRGDSHV